MKTGNIDEKEMYNVFNMGIGFILAVNKEDVETVLSKLNEINEKAYVIGSVTNSGEVDLKW
jgi:phosphoribosylformylglycinamidine cyclo-ligase